MRTFVHTNIVTDGAIVIGTQRSFERTSLVILYTVSYLHPLPTRLHGVVLN
jgi:hypothetical protein